MADGILQFRLNQAIAGKQQAIREGNRDFARRYSALEKSLRKEIRAAKAVSSAPRVAKAMRRAQGVISRSRGMKRGRSSGKSKSSGGRSDH